MQNGSALVDTSALIEYFRGNSLFSFMEKLIVEKTLFVNELILAEFLPSCVKRNEFIIAAIVNSVQQIPMNINWKEIRDNQITML